MPYFLFSLFVLVLMLEWVFNTTVLHVILNLFNLAESDRVADFRQRVRRGQLVYTVLFISRRASVLNVPLQDKELSTTEVMF